MARPRRWIARGLALLGGTLAALSVAELVLRIHTPSLVLGVGQVIPSGAGLDIAPESRLFTYDPEFGFRPLPGGKRYDRHGAIYNDYPLEKPAGVRRLLFLGDSVTARGRIVAALRERFGDAGIEYWNAGIESFSPPQEALYYERFLGGIHEDHLILTFHHNDFSTTPLTSIDERGKLVVYQPRLPLLELSPWLFRHSLLYRLWIALRLELSSQEEVDTAFGREIEGSLERLKRLSEARGARLTVLFFPFVLPRDRWSPVQEERRRMALALFERLGIPCIDLTPLLPESDGQELARLREASGDTYHPSALFAGRIADFVRESGFVP